MDRCGLGIRTVRLVDITRSGQLRQAEVEYLGLAAIRENKKLTIRSDNDNGG